MRKTHPSQGCRIFGTLPVCTHPIRFLTDYLFADFSSRIYTYSLLIGLISGLAAALFTWGLEPARFVFVERLAGFQQLRPAGEVAFDFSFLGQPVYAHHTWVLALLPALGGLISGYLVYRVAPEAEGHGTDAMIDAFHNHRGFIRPVVPAVKGAATILVLGSGGSAGKEGPVAQIGAGLGSWLATRLGLSAAQRRILLLAGTAGGLGAIFRAPLGGALTSVEVLYREDFESDALVPCVISSITAYSMYTGIYGFSPIFAIPDLAFTDARELLAYMVLGILCALAGILYVKVFYGLRDHFFRKLSLPKYLIVALGGLLVGLLGLLDARTMGGGFGVIQEGLWGHVGWQVFLALVFLKIVATSCTISSGGSGGVFGPSLFIGGMLGGAVGIAGHHYFPSLVHQPAAYIVVGMASFFACVANAPLASLIMFSEMTGSYNLLPPLMLVCAFALLFTRRFSIYENQVKNKFHSPAHLKEFTVNVLEKLEAGAVLPRLKNPTAAIITNERSCFELEALSRKLGHLHFVVVNGDGHLRGMIRLDDLELREDEALRNLILVEDLVVEGVEWVEENDDLHLVLQKLPTCAVDHGSCKRIG